MKLLFWAAAAWVVYRIAQENSDTPAAALLSPPKARTRKVPERAVM